MRRSALPSPHPPQSPIGALIAVAQFAIIGAIAVHALATSQYAFNLQLRVAHSAVEAPVAMAALGLSLARLADAEAKRPVSIQWGDTQAARGGVW